MSFEQPCRKFTFDEIQKATDDFNESKIIGKGGFGSVYKALVDNGSTTILVALKRLTPESKQGIKEFETEIHMLSKCRHCNLVNLVGYCNEHGEMILVYEYMSQGNLGDHLYMTRGSLLTWEQRLKICIGVARGIDYLHTGTGLVDRIIHLDVKSDNILLNENWDAKIADLGLSKKGPANQLQSEVATYHLQGTPGYMCPHYLKTNKYSRKTDVYSFGVVLLEVLTGTSIWGGKIIPNNDLSDWIQKHISGGTLNQIIDPRIVSQIQLKCVERFAYTASKSLQDDPDKRPSMSAMVALLESALQWQSSSSMVKDDLFQLESEQETSSIQEYLALDNIFGEPIVNKTMAQMRLNPTRENKARVAYKMMNEGNKYDNALRFVKNLKYQWGDGVSTLCMLYNATGETLTYTGSHNWIGDIVQSPYPTFILNGQWGAYLHGKTPSPTKGSIFLRCLNIDTIKEASASVAAVVYRGKYSDNALCDYMISWSIPWRGIAHNNAAYCEINEVGHFKGLVWDIIYYGTAHRESSDTWNDSYIRVKVESDTSPVYKAILTRVDALASSV